MSVHKNTNHIIVALTGRPNVGKSTLFNRLLEERKALETNIPGTTRDRNRGIFNWDGKSFEVIDSPGIVLKDAQDRKIKTDQNMLEYNVQLQTQYAQQEANIILYIVDVGGIFPEDYEIIKRLRKTKKPVVLVVNKADKREDAHNAAQFIKLGLGEPLALSAKNGLRVSDLCDALVTLSKKIHVIQEKKDFVQNSIRLAIIGKPNVGKSSLFNSLLQEHRVVVSPVAHTTRDPNDTHITHRGQAYTIIDTAGLRKKAKTHKSVETEKFSVQKTLNIIKRADVCLLVVDASDGVYTQDVKISSLLKETHAGIVIVVNKWDTIPQKNTGSLGLMRKNIYARFKSLNWAPCVFSNVLNAQSGHLFGLEEKFLDGAKSSEKNPYAFHRLLDLIFAVYKNTHATLDMKRVKSIFETAVKKQPPPRGGNMRRAKILRIEQTGAHPPEISVTIPTRTILPRHYIGYLQRELRKSFPLWGTPIIFLIKH